MIPKRVASRPGRSTKTGNRRKVPLDERGCGWRHRPRTKVSKYADKGYLYEVRLEHYQAWSDLPPGTPGRNSPTTSRYDAILDQFRSSTQCRIVGRFGQTIINGYTKRNIRIYLRTEEDLFLLRLMHDDVFRVYRLVSPSAATAAA